jgi:hypothetical protein
MKSMNQYSAGILIYAMMNIHFPISKVKDCTNLNGNILLGMRFRDLKNPNLPLLAEREVTGHFYKIM